MSTDDWEPQEPSRDFVDRVMDRVREETEGRTARPRRFGKLGARVAIGLAVAAAIALFGPWGFSIGSRRGDEIAASREEVHVGRRAIAVLESGAHVTWDGDEVTQTAGEVFYRVESRLFGQAFHVHTPQGDVEVLGTCFRVRVDDAEVEVNKRDLKVGSLGAALSAVVFVSVYEGKVALSHAAERVTLTAGESARSSNLGVARTSGSADDTKASADPLLAANANLADSVREYKRRLDAIEAQKASVEKQLETAKEKLAVAVKGGHVEPYKSEYDLSPDDLKELAKKGEVRAHFPCPDEETWTQSPEVLGALGLAPEDAAPIRDAMKQSADRVWSVIRPICVQALGGNAQIADKLGPRNCQTFVLDSSDHLGEDADEEVRKVAEIRAGLIPMPSDPKALGLFGQMVYTLSGESKAMEQQLAQTFGPETAHKVVFGPDGESADACGLKFAGGPRSKGPAAATTATPPR